MYALLCLLLGINHKIQFTCCACEPLGVTLTRANLWPATPSNPRFAFSFALLDLAEALLLECQVAVKDFCNVLRFRNPFSMLKVSYLHHVSVHYYKLWFGNYCSISVINVHLVAVVRLFCNN